MRSAFSESTGLTSVVNTSPAMDLEEVLGRHGETISETIRSAGVVAPKWLDVACSPVTRATAYISAAAGLSYMVYQALV